MTHSSFLKGFSRNLILVGFVSLFTDLSSQMVFPLIPLYLVSLGTGVWVVGLVEGAAESTASFVKVFSGYWSDKIKKRKPFIFAGYGLSTLTKPLFAVAIVWPLVLLIRVVERIGKGIRNAPRDAIVAESTDKKYRGKAYGFHRAMDGIGSILGAFLAVLLLPLFSFKGTFLIAFIPGLLAVFCIIFIREKAVEKKEKKQQCVQSLKVSLKLLPRNLKVFIGISALFSFGYFGYAFLLLKGNEIGLQHEHTLLLYLLLYSIYTLFSIPAGMLSDSIGRKKVLLIGYCLSAGTAFFLLFSTTVLFLLIAFVLYGVFFACIDCVQRAYVVDLSPAHLKGTALGTFHTMIGLCALPGGLLLGIVWDVFSSDYTFLFAGMISLITFILLFFIRSAKKTIVCH